MLLRDDLTKLMRSSPFQPATNLWRAFEIAAIKEWACDSLAQANILVDLGCGDGVIMGLLKEGFPGQQRIVGIDLDPSEVLLAKKSGLYAEVYCAGGDELPLPDRAADAVFSNSVLEHIIPIEQTLAEVSRVLMPGGLFVATVPGPDFHACLRGPWLGGSKEAYNAYIDRRLAHERYWTSLEWQAALTKVGITEVRAIPYLSLKQVRRWEILSNLTGGVLSKLLGMKPMAVQKTLGLRKRTLRLPRWIAAVITRALLFGLDQAANRPQPDLYGCLIILGRKREEEKPD